MARHEAHDAAALFHVNSANLRSRAVPLALDYDHRPPRFKSFPRANRIRLPAGHFRVAQTVGAALQHRRSCREFALRRLPLTVLSQILYLSHGVRGVRDVEGEKVLDRCSPSAGGLYPIELYVATQMVDGVPDGIHHYDARFHRLEQVLAGTFHHQLADLTIGQDMIRTANLVVVLTAIFRRTMWKYGVRGYRYAWLDAGHVGQNLYLAAGAMQLGAVTIGGFFDTEVNQLLQLPPEESAIYLACVGHPATAGIRPTERTQHA
jgi:SagB-type dehydrogenase family enzyme